MQDGGGVSFTSLFDLMLRCSTGRQEETDRAFQRAKDIQSWFEDVKAAGGEGRDFYRAYYDGHPERGLQQSPKPGGIGLDREFLGDGSLGAIFPAFAFLGLKSVDDGILDITPAIPTELGYMGVENVYFRGHHLRIEAGRNYVSLEGSRLDGKNGMKARIRFKNAPDGAGIWTNGQQIHESQHDGKDLVVVVPLTERKVEMR